MDKAYDSVWLEGIILKLHEHQIRGPIRKLIANILIERNFRIRYADFISQQFEPEVGLPQCSVFSPVLFIIFINDICINCKSKVYKDADDLTLLAT